MQRIFIFLCLVSRASFEMETVQHFYMSRKARSNSQPTKTGYVYTQVNNEPPKFSTFYNGYSHSMSKMDDRFDDSAKRNEKFKDKCIQCYNKTGFEDLIDSKIKSESLKLAASNNEPIYDKMHDYHTDDEDVRTDSRSYDGWPYFYQSLYEYEPIKYDIEYEKAKDKRFTPDDVIPVHENVDDIPDSNVYSGSDYMRSNVYTTDNPIYGNQPFFSYILNDYFDKTNDDDPLNFKGISFEKEIDHEMPFEDIYNNPKRKRRIDENYQGDNTDHDTLKERIRGNKFDRNREFENSEKGNDNKHSYKGDYKHDGNNYRGFKDFADAFLNKFGSEDHNKVAKYSIKNNADKGQKKKGFRNVYHKDEYQEHNEFFDDKNSSINNEETGDSKLRAGGSGALLRSQASAALGNDRNEIKKAENVESNNFNKSHSGKQAVKGIDKDFSHYRDVAKDAALSNNADYFNL